MKKIISITLTALLCLTMSAQKATLDTTGYCPITKGLTLKYANYDENGKITGYYISKVTSIEGDLTKGRVIFDQSFYDKDDKARFTDNSLIMEVSVGEDEYTISKMSSLTMLMKVQDDISKGDASSIPTTLSTGQTIADGKIKIKAGAAGATITTTGRKVTERKEITTKAGTFDAYLIKETQYTKSFGTKEERLESWYVKGIGCIKQKVYDKKGRLVQSQELISITY